MRLLLLLSLAFSMLVPSLARAQALYVSDVQEISLRSGPSAENKIIASAKSGTTLEKIRDEGEWTLVRMTTPPHKEGYVLKRFLTAQPPVTIQLEQFKTKNAEALEKASKIDEILGKGEEERQALSKQLGALEREHETLRGRYEQLRKDAANVTELHDSLETAKASLAETQATMERERAERRNLETGAHLTWFAAGGGTILLGWIIGFFTGRVGSKRNYNRLLR